MTVDIYTATMVLPMMVADSLATCLANDARFEALPVVVHETEAGTAEVTIHFRGPPPRRALEKLASPILAAGGVKKAPFAVKRLPVLDWVAESLKELAPVRAGRFLVHGRHDRSSARPNDVAIEIEAGLAFGTGHHGTTIGCLMGIGEVLKSRSPAKAADIGTGSGVLAIAIAKAARIPVLATDNDPVAVAVARENCRANGVSGAVCAVSATGTGHTMFAKLGPFDLIVANILANPLAAMAYEVSKVAAPGATLVLSGLLPEQRRRIVAMYRMVGFRPIRAFTVDGWLTVLLRSPPQGLKRRRLVHRRWR